MIFQFVQFLKGMGCHVPQVFLYTSTRAMLAAVTSLLFSMLLGPFFINKLYQLKIGQPIRRLKGFFLLSELHKGKDNTPTMGGILFIASMLLSLFLWMDYSSVFTWLLFVTTVILASLGGYDDYLKLRYKNHKGLSGKKKLCIQLFVALLVIAYLQVPEISNFFSSVVKVPKIIDETGQRLDLFSYSSRLYMPFFKDPLLIFSGVGLILLWGFLSFVVVGSSNAVNLTDGLDGLAAGLVTMVAACFGIFSFLSNNIEIADYLNICYVESSGEIAIFMAATCGGLLGFLWYNGHPAELFMGDIGSLTLGGILGVTAVLLNREFLLALVGALFVIEALSVIIQVASYRLKKRRPFLCAPIHHHFEYKGMKETKVVIRFWIVGILLALVGLLTLKFQ